MSIFANFMHPVSKHADNRPLHFAVRAGNKDIVELLIANGADVNTKNEAGQTPRDVALRRNQKEIVELLRKHGAQEDKEPESSPREE